MKGAYYSDLAIAFIQGRLSLQEKQLVFRMLMEDPEFRELMRLELGLASTLAGLKTGAPSTLKERVYCQVRKSNEVSLAAELTKAILTPILNIGLPKWVSQLMTFSQRSV